MATTVAGNEAKENARLINYIFSKRLMHPFAKVNIFISACDHTVSQETSQALKTTTTTGRENQIIQCNGSKNIYFFKVPKTFPLGNKSGKFETKAFITFLFFGTRALLMRYQPTTIGPVSQAFHWLPSPGNLVSRPQLTKARPCSAKALLESTLHFVGKIMLLNFKFGVLSFSELRKTFK